MNPITRRPTSCPFRRGDECVEGKATCDLVGRLLQGTAHNGAEVDLRICSACCRHPLFEGPRLNPVVASLAYRAANGPAIGHQPDTRQRVVNHQLRQFAIRWLASADDTVPPRGSPLAECRNDGYMGHTHATRYAELEEEQPAIRIGLVGRNSKFGLGHQNRDIADHLNVDRWLVPHFSDCGDLEPRGMKCRIDLVSTEPSLSELVEWLSGIDVVIFVESPIVRELTSRARQMGVGVVCVPNWEWLHAGMEWLEDVDLMLCPTRYTGQLLSDWKTKFQFTWAVEVVPWPIDTGSFDFRQRTVCRKFVFVNGSGGASAASGETSSVVMQRKGLEVLVEAARRVPHIPVIVYAQSKDIGSTPPNVQCRPAPKHNIELYHHGDVCIQPSHWEGLGLPLLECQASGMPLITTDLPPMNEHQPLAAIPAEVEAVFLDSELCIPAARIDSEALADVLHSVHGRDITDASLESRKFIEREHDWPTAKPRILDCILRHAGAAR